MNSDPTNPNDKRQERNRRPDEQPVQPVLPGLEKYVTTPEHEQAADQTELVEDSGRRRTKPPVQAKAPERAQRYKDEDDEDADDYDDDDDRAKKSKRSKSSQGSPTGTNQPFTFSVDGVKTFLIQYWQSAGSVCMAPVPFYEAMPRKGGYTQTRYILGCWCLRTRTHSFLLASGNPLCFSATWPLRCACFCCFRAESLHCSRSSSARAIWKKCFESWLTPRHC